MNNWPWYVGGVIALVALVAAWRFLGWRGALAVIGATALAAFGRKQYEAGYDARARDGKKETDNAIRDADRARAGADTDRMHNDGWRRD